MEECGNSKRVYDSDDELWAENRSKRLHDPLLMKNNNDEPKKKTEEIKKKRQRKVTSTVSRPTLPKLCDVSDTPCLFTMLRSSVYSGFFENNERTNWSVLDAYKDKQTGVPLESHIPFNIEYAEGIMQQEDDSLDCGLYVATFAEFLSDQLVIPPDTDGHLANYLCNRYAALLWRYGSDKVNGGYISDNDDTPKPKGQFTTPTEDDIVNID